MEITMPQDKIILAIDGLNIKQAKSFLKICPGIRWVKVGLELFSREGPEAIKILKQMDKKIAEELGIPINNTDDPLSSVVIGSGICLERFQDYKSVLKQSPKPN